MSGLRGGSSEHPDAGYPAMAYCIGIPFDYLRPQQNTDYGQLFSSGSGELVGEG
ncbi:TPA: hypothetical protein PXP39_004191 [Yersinia enterocolitica]|nr:hypothetical protein [Yersinia enterocolitica]HDL7834238.1 hypothetical protein [Yersinia enterocolitica]HDL7875090.1 hypothetical protein [Yersinia enterocolitica]HDL7887699.1 hypothetical protein [Yersinia enterocolitica]HDL7896288.1 hypothetical protein [Yersinia enterocolitica]